MKFQRIFAMTAVAAFALSTLTGCPWEQEGDAPSAPSSSSSRPSHDSGTDSGSDPDTPSSTPEDEEGIIEKGDGYTFNKKTNTYTVEKESGLQAWANFAKDNPNTNCTLTDNIEMSSWDGLKNYYTPYTGTFDGNGKTISGLDASLFFAIGSGGTVKNLTIVGTISGRSGIATDNSGTIVNCTIKADIRDSGDIAGIAFKNESGGEIIGCVVTGDVSGVNTASGIVYENEGTITGCMVTGTVSGVNTASGIAVNNFGTITACAVTGDVEAKGNGPVKGDAGGIVAHGTADTCYYSGTVTPGQGESVNDAGTPVTDGWTQEIINTMNAQLDGCEYVFALDQEKQPKLVKRNSAEQAVNRLLAQFWG